MIKNSYVKTFINFLQGEEKRRIYFTLLRMGSNLSDEETEIMWQLSQDDYIRSILDQPNSIYGVKPNTEYVYDGKTPKKEI